MAYQNLRLCTMGMHGQLVNSVVSSQPNLPRMWFYQWTDAIATVRAANYFFDAKQRGMKVNDIVYVVVAADNTFATAVSICVVAAVASTGADLTDGTVVALTNT